ncbi:MAG: Lrp/AsnC family transcriptional regulator [Acidimicrobiales bacterium]
MVIDDGLDHTDKAIIRELQVDGRMAHAKLAGRIGMSEAATRQRVRRLIERGVMEVVAVTDPTALGAGLQAMLAITVDDDARVIAEKLSRLPEVDYLVLTAGRADILCEVVCADSAHLLELVNGQLRGIAGVRTIEVSTYLHLLKQSYSWGTG